MKKNIHHLEFVPAIKNGKIQTILASLVNRAKVPAFHRETLQLEDGEPLFLDISQPDDWTPKNFTVVLMHGLCGCSESSYLLRLTSQLIEHNVRVVRMNLRGEGDRNKRHAKSIYHGGSSGDLKEVLMFLKHDAPDSKMIAVGFSISGNILLRLLGDFGSQANVLIHYAISVCPPVDLLKCSEVINEPRNRIFQRYFVKSLIALMKRRHHDFPELGVVPKLSKKMSLFAFDDQYTSKQAGFKDAKDYYSRSSAISVIQNITVKTDVLLALDDPFVDNQALLENQNIPGCVNIHVTEHGGHMGYLEYTKGMKFFSRWMDKKIMEWILKNINS